MRWIRGSKTALAVAVLHLAVFTVSCRQWGEKEDTSHTSYLSVEFVAYTRPATHPAPKTIEVHYGPSPTPIHKGTGYTPHHGQSDSDGDAFADAPVNSEAVAWELVQGDEHTGGNGLVV